MSDVIIVALISGFFSALVVFLQLRTEKYRKERDKKEKEDNILREEKEHDNLDLSLARGKLIKTNGELAYVTSLAVNGQHTNGNVEAAQKEYVAAAKTYDALESMMARKYLYKN